MSAPRAEKPPKRRTAVSDPIAAGTRVFLSVGLVASLAVVAVLVRREDATWIAYAVALLVALGFGIALLGSPLTRLNACLVVVSIAVSLYIAEALLATEVIGTGAREPVLDQRTRLEVLAARRAQGADAWPPGIPAVFVASDGLPDDADPLYPLAGIPNVEIIYCRDGLVWQSYVSDEHGFNNPPGLHRVGRVDVVIVGDSFAHGSCVPPGEDTAGRLRALDIDALSLGMDGSGPLIELATLTEYGLSLRPKHVVWFYYEGNDLENLKSERSSPFLRRYLNDRGFSQNLRGRQTEIAERLKAWMSRMEQSAARSGKLATLTAIAKLGHLRSRLGLGVGRPVPDDFLRQVLREAHQRVKQVGASFTIAYLPSPWRFRRDRADDGDFDYRDLVRGWMREDGFDVVDFGEVIGKDREPLAFFGLDGHFNPQGYRRLAEVLAAHWTGQRRAHGR